VLEWEKRQQSCRTPDRTPRKSETRHRNKRRVVGMKAERAPLVGRPRKIVGFHLDERSDWVADLECGHQQHVRHNPPWTTQHWVTTPEGRREHIGRELPCLACVD
jgi:hypothetical protein